MTLDELGPGVFVDDEGTLHLDLPEICAALGVEATEENQAAIERAAIDLFSRSPGGVAVTEISDGGRGAWR